MQPAVSPLGQHDLHGSSEHARVNTMQALNHCSNTYVVDALLSLLSSTA
jgi:hypothetical protein